MATLGNSMEETKSKPKMASKRATQKSKKNQLDEYFIKHSDKILKMKI